MEYIIGALIMWTVISWIWFILEQCFVIDIWGEKVYWFLFAPMWILVLIFLPYVIYKNRKPKRKK